MVKNLPFTDLDLTHIKKETQKNGFNHKSKNLSHRASKTTILQSTIAHP